MQRPENDASRNVLKPRLGSSSQSFSGAPGTVYSRDFSQRLQNSLGSGLSYSGGSLGFLRNSNSIHKSRESRGLGKSPFKNDPDSETGSHFRGNGILGSEIGHRDKREIDASADFQGPVPMHIHANNKLSRLFESSSKTIDIQNMRASNSAVRLPRTKNRTSIMAGGPKSKFRLDLASNDQISFKLGKRESHFNPVPQINHVFRAFTPDRDSAPVPQLKRIRETELMALNHPHFKSKTDSNAIHNSVKNMDPKTFWALFKQNFPDMNIQDLTRNMNPSKGTELRPEIVENLGDIMNYFIDPLTSNIFLKIGNQEMVPGVANETQLVPMKNYLNMKEKGHSRRGFVPKQGMLRILRNLGFQGWMYSVGACDQHISYNC